MGHGRRADRMQRLMQILYVAASLNVWHVGFAAESKATNHWAFQPVKRPAAPRLSAGKPELRNEIDAFIVARLRTKGLALSPEADRRTLIRRACFDLIGLPPSPEEVS